MTDDNKLFAWADRTNLGVGEHTWVTSYAPGSGEPDPSKGDYWYCWGDAHGTCRELDHGSGGREFAQWLASAHDPRASVGIRYGHEGLCHQMANRLLRFTPGDNGRPLTVRRAKGYQLSVAAYGPYGGKNSFARTKSACLSEWERRVTEYLSRSRP